MFKLLKIFVILTLLIFLSYPETASAAGLTVLSDTMTRLATTTLSNHDLKFRTENGMSSTTATLDFNTGGFSSGSVNYTDIDLQYGLSQAQVNGTCSSSCTKATLAGSAGADAWGAVFATNTLTFTYPTSGGTSIAGNDYVRVLIGLNATTGDTGDQQMTNPGTVGSKVITITLPSDSGKIAVAIADSSDQVLITADVDPSISFGLSANSSAFGTLAPGIIDTADTSITLTIGTNAASGYTVSVRDQGNATNPGLYNATASAIIGSGDASFSDQADLSGVSVGYGIQAACTAGCTTNTDIASRWRQGGDTVGGLEVTDTPLATYGSTMTADHTIQTSHKAKAASFTPAGSYSDTLTYIATANF